jgi:nitrite reductase/ring-hydroxylating ferredoxin subunit
MPFVRIGALSDVPPGSVMQAELGENTYAICNVGGEVHVLDGICPHSGGPLGEGALHDNMVVCPWHAWEYDCRTGENDFDPNVRVEKFEVRIEGNDILIETAKSAGTS